jgi:hypothetical protein
MLSWQTARNQADPSADGIHSDIRQIKSDVQSLLFLLKQQQQKQTPASPSNSDQTTNAIETASSGSPEDVLRYLRETRGEDDMGEASLYAAVTGVPIYRAFLANAVAAVVLLASR